MRKISRFTQREQEFLVLLASNLTTREIAAKMVITEASVKNLCHGIYKKMPHVKNKWVLRVYAKTVLNKMV